MAEPIRPEKPKWQLSNLFSGQNRRNTQTYNEDYARYQWDLENWYNEPKRQMARFEDAGLSRNLMYGQASSGNAESMPNVAPYRPVDDLVSEIKGLGPLQQLMDAKLKLSQIKDIDASAEVKAANAAEIRAETRSQDSGFIDKDNVWTSAEGVKWDHYKLPYRDRKKVTELIMQKAKLEEQFKRTKSAGHQESILKKIAEKQNMILYFQMVSQLGGALRFL